MKRLSLAAGTITIVFCTFMLLSSEFKPRQLSIESMRPVLDAVSRLDRVVIVPPSPYIRIGWPQICFLDSLKFRPLTQLLFRFKGNADWAIISDLPRACIITRLRVIPPDADAESLVARAEDAAKRDISKLSVYLNAAIGEAVRANGITVQPGPLELPLMHDAVDPPGVVYLVRDPTLFLESGLAPLQNTIGRCIFDRRPGRGKDYGNSCASRTVRCPISESTCKWRLWWRK